MNNLEKFNGIIQNAKTQDYLKKVLNEKSSEFVNNITAIVGGNEKLQQCEPMSLLYAGIKATALDLPIDPNLGFAYIIPYGQKAQFQLGYKGLKQLAIRTGQYQRINTTDVRSGEILGVNRMTGDVDFRWIDSDKERNATKVVGYLSYFRLNNGFENTLYMTIEEIENHGKKYSKTYNNGVWKTDFDKMAVKTVTKLNLSRNGIMSVKLQDGIKFDQSVITEEQEAEYIDNEDAKSFDPESDISANDKTLKLISDEAEK